MRQRTRTAADPRQDRISRPDVCIQRQARAARHRPKDRTRQNRRIRRQNRQRQIDAGESHPATARAPDGSVLVDGRPVREYPLAQLRKAIGFVPQETFLFSDTLAANIAFGVSEPPALAGGELKNIEPDNARRDTRRSDQRHATYARST